MSWEKSPNLVSGERTEYLTTVDMKSCIVKVYPSAMTYTAAKCFVLVKFVDRFYIFSVLTINLMVSDDMIIREV